MEIARADVKVWPIRLGSEDGAVPRDQSEPSAFAGEQADGQDPHGQRIEAAQEDGQGRYGQKRYPEFPRASLSSSTRPFSISNEMQGIDDDVDKLDPRERRDEAAQAVDQEVAPEEGRRAQRAEAHPAERQGDEGDDDQGVEDDRAQDGARPASEGP